MKYRYLALGFAVGVTVCALGFYIVGSTMDAAMTSKTKRLVADGYSLVMAIEKYKTQAGTYPIAFGATELHKKGIGLSGRDCGCDYFSNGDHFTLVYPAIAGEFTWDLLVFQDGRLVRVPSYARDLMRDAEQAPN
jgi:hypothetical protein